MVRRVDMCLAFKLLIINMKKNISILLSLAIFILVVGGVVAALIEDNAPRRVLSEQRMLRADSVITNAIAQGDFAGAVLCVVSKAEDGESMGDLLYLKAYGNRQVTSGRDAVSGEFKPDTIAMTTDAIFDLASMSKCVGTTLAFMRVVEDGLVRLSDNVNRYIPDFDPWESKPTKKGEKVEKQYITIKDLLTHTSGLPSYIDVNRFVERMQQNGSTDGLVLRDSLISYLADSERVRRISRPGEELRYSCLNMILVQAIIERVTGQRLDHYARQEVFEPMGLSSTWYNCIDDPKRPFSADAPIVPTEVQPSGKVLLGEVHDPLARVANRGVSGNAGLFSSAEDLATVASVLMNGGVLRTPSEGAFGKLGGTERRRIFSKQAVDCFFRIPAGYEAHGRALGWDFEGGNGDLLTPKRVASHTGYTGTSIAIDLELGLSIILLTNRVHPKDDGSVARTRNVVSNIVASALEQ